MDYVKSKNQKHSNSTNYYLSQHELEELQRKYGRPGEIAPGQPAPKKRKRLDEHLSELDRRGKNLIELSEIDYEKPVIH
ncbi:hypothetical protein SPSYN_00532 [Sporotomaculum syntrophicum]|uniref:Uncharacterized protein n=1 Tax=Sporotomaculum syntrophicum TaxID=182264 RepID=A0A9D2WRK7_9FIRM|nr:hypothetical protein [Sporotomaculum syntrophicum]KAF1085803.1 hypothetical protein SPSYN_00532 [Sporotomaculum syntrophicum]